MNVASASEIQECESSSLPAGWISSLLGDLTVRSEYGTSVKCDYKGNFIPVLRIPNIAKGEIDLTDLKHAGSPISIRTDDELQVGDMLVCRTNGSLSLLGKTAVIKSQFHSPHSFASYLLRFRFIEREVLPRWLHLFFSSVGRKFIEQNAASSAGQHNISLAKLHSMPIVVAPINEQRRIVAKIEELFSDLDAGIAALERAKGNLKRYRATVLKAAVEGKLTNESHDQLFDERHWIEIGTLLTCVEQGWSPKCERVAATSHHEWAVMKTSAVLPMQFLDAENKRLPDSLSPETKLEVQTDDLLITRAGPRNRAAVTCLVRSSRPRLIVCDKIYRIRCDRAKVMPAYLEVVLNSPPIIDALDDMKTGISDSGVNLTQQKFRRLKIPVPPLSIQNRIVDKVEERLSVATVAEIAIEHDLLRAARLRQSILKEAFDGRLVSQNATDEPADMFLERMRASRLAHQGNGMEQPDLETAKSIRSIKPTEASREKRRK